jgi:hypothetical protein
VYGSGIQGLALRQAWVIPCGQSQDIRARYEHELLQIMNQYGVHNEAEIVSGCISKFAKHRRKKGDIKQMIMEAVRALRKKMLRQGTWLLLAQSLIL